MKIIRVLAPVINILPEGVIRFIGHLASDYILTRYAKLEVEGAEGLTERIGKPTIFIANHLSNVDGIVLNKILEKNNVTFIAGKKLKENPFTSVFLKIVKHIIINPNSADRNALKKAVAVLNRGESILIFPEGTRSRTGSMIRGKKGFVLLARLSKADIVPIALEGTEQMLPINPNDMGLETPKHANVRVKVGQPFQLEPKNPDSEDPDQECVDAAMRKISQLLSPQYQGVYRINP
jgi:1-acyl-sn-glycerol-3-phosphate acyltransferase